MTKSFSRLLACVALMALNQCKTHHVFESHGPIFRETLVQTLRKATKVSIEEHSSPEDFAGLHSSHPRPEIHYGKATLSTEAGTAFLNQVKAMSSASIYGYAKCIPAYHHTIRFYEGERLMSTMEVCFECETISWDACAMKCPDDFFKVLELVVTGAGLHPKRDWEALVKGTPTSSQGPR